MIPIPNHPDVSVLNCGAGDMTFSFDPKDPLEVARASRVVKDMLARGYMLFAKVGKQLVRVKRFDESTCEYILADWPGAVDDDPSSSESDPNDTPLPALDPGPVKAEQPKPPARRRGRPPKRLPAHKTPVTGIAPTAGG